MKPINVTDFAREVLLHGSVVIFGAIGVYLIRSDGVRVFVLSLAVFLLLVSLILHANIKRLFRFIRAGESFKTRGMLQHELIHRGRDTAVRILAALPIQTLVGKGRSPLTEYRVDIIGLLEDVVRIFQKLAPPRTRVWASLRELRADGLYYTFDRAGSYSPARIATSTPLHKKKSATMTNLIDSLNNGHCVILSGSGKGPERWTSQPNDRFGEDKCVLMGAVMLRYCEDKTFDLCQKQMIWVLTVCADRENAFNDTHVPWMQGYVDIFSTLANILARSPDVPNLKMEHDVAKKSHENANASEIDSTFQI